MDISLSSEAIAYIIQGAWVTLEYALVSVFFGFLLGVLIALAKVSRSSVAKGIARFYTSLIRGTPLLLQLSFVYFATPALTGYQIGVFLSGIIAFSLNSGAYVSEVIRGGIEGIEHGQFEAAKALGVPYWQMMKDIILPQAIRKIVPSLINEAINLLKESAIISVIGGADLMRRAQVVAATEYSYFEPLLVAGASYYVLVLILSTCASLLEKRLKKNSSQSKTVFA
jgi:His/Glu/Gln/Arg/opine family amino acid ABC transporter permease subunit